MTEAGRALAASRLFAALPERILGDVGHLMRPAAFDAGEVVFRQGRPGDHLIVVESGKLEAWLSTPGGRELLPSVIGPGDVIGELSLLGDGRRTATVRAVESSRGWLLDRPAFELLRLSGATAGIAAVAERIGRIAVERLDALYRRTASVLPGDPRGAEPRPSPLARIELGEAEAAYLPGIRFFEHFKPADIAEVMDGLPRLALARGELLASAGEPPPALWIVVRGAVETVIRGSIAARRMRLAGPGRAVGHCGLLGPRAFARQVESRARERAVLIELSWARVGELLGRDDEPSHAFAAAFWTDAVRALQHGEQPLPQMTAAPRARPVIR
jgi:CRP/FNR family transcriptional regulator, cyclic AMP receptor protein